MGHSQDTKIYLRDHILRYLNPSVYLSISTAFYYRGLLNEVFFIVFPLRLQLQLLLSAVLTRSLRKEFFIINREGAYKLDAEYFVAFAG